MYPGDLLVNNDLVSRSPYRSQLSEGSLRQLVDEQYRQEISSLKEEKWLTEADAQAIERDLRHNLKLRMTLFEPTILDQITFSLKVSDIRENPYFEISTRSGEPRVERSSTPSPDSILEIEVRSEILRCSLSSDWGGDALTIGYGCEIQIARKEIIESNLDVVCVQLLTRIPVASRHWRKEPLRMVRHVLSSTISRGWAGQAAWNRLRGLPATTNDHNDKMRAWLFRTKCEVCRACDLPMLDEKFAQTL